MNVHLIEESRSKAGELKRDYYKALRISRRAEDRKLYLAYKELEKGHKVLALPEAMALAGLDESFRPRLAISRADHERVEWRPNGTQGGEFRNPDPRPWQSRRGPERGLVARLPASIFGMDSLGYHSRWSAIVPIIPPRLRPADELSNYHILWEAEWQNVAPRDPLLLRRIARDIYAVLAVWDLTDLERAILAGRAV